MSDFIFQIIQFAWQDNPTYLLPFIIVLSLLLFYIKSEVRGRLRSTLVFFTLSILGLLISGLLNTFGYSSLAPKLYIAFIIAEGFAIIRLSGLFVFSILFPLIKLNLPGILEDIVLIIGYFFWVLLQLHYAGVPLAELVTTSAVMTAILAFSMREILGNIFGGLALQMDQSLKIGDWIRINDIEGKIIDIHWRAIMVETRNWETVAIPNSILMNNYFKVLGKRFGQPVQWRRWIWFNIDYTISPFKIIEIAEKAVCNAKLPNVAAEPSPNCLLMDFDKDSGLARYAMRYWLTWIIINSG